MHYFWCVIQQNGFENVFTRGDVEALRLVNKTAKILESDYKFAIDLINTDLPKREDYLVSLIYKSDIDIETKKHLMERLVAENIVR